MRVRCKALVEDGSKRDALCMAIEALGGKPIVVNIGVHVYYVGNEGDAIIELFEECEFHSISVIA